MSALPALPWAAVIGVAGILGFATLGFSYLPDRWGLVALIAVLCPFAALAAGNLRRVLLAVILLDLPLQIDGHLNYRLEAAEMGGLVGLNVSVTTLALAVLYAVWLAGLLSRIGAPPRPALRASLPPALYLVFVGLSFFVARDAELASFEVALLAQTFLLFVYVVSTVRTRQDVVFIMTMLAAGLLLEGALFVTQWFVGPDVALPGLSARNDVAGNIHGQQRLAGTIGGVNAAAIYLSLMLAPAASLLITPLGKWHKRLAMLSVTFGAAALILTLTRGGWLAFGLSMALLGLFASRRGWLSPGAPLVGAGLLLVIGLVFQDLILSRFVADDQGSTYSRFPLMMLALRIIQDHPLLGIGANNFIVAMPQYATPDFSEYGGEWLFVVHNKFLLVWAETGLLGLLSFVGYLLAIVWTGWRGWQLGDPLLSPMALGITAAVLGHIFYMWGDIFSARPQVQALWLIAALLAAIARMGRSEAAEPGFADSATLVTAPSLRPGRGNQAPGLANV